MPARLDALRDHRVDPGRGGRLRLGDRADLVDPGRWSRPPRLAPEGHYRVGLRGRFGVAAPYPRQQQVDGDRLVGQSARGGELVGDPGSRAADRPQPAGFRDGGGELVPGDRAHPRLDDRRVELREVEGHRGVRA